MLLNCQCGRNRRTKVSPRKGKPGDGKSQKQCQRQPGNRATYPQKVMYCQNKSHQDAIGTREDGQGDADSRQWIALTGIESKGSQAESQVEQGLRTQRADKQRKSRIEQECAPSYQRRSPGVCQVPQEKPSHCQTERAQQIRQARQVRPQISE